MEKQLVIRLDEPIYAHLQQQAADLGLTVTEYARLMVAWDVPYLLLWADVRKILSSGKDDLTDQYHVLRNALRRLETGEAELTALVEQIQAGLPQAQEASRQAVVELKAMLQEQAQQAGTWADAFRTLRKRLGEQAEKGQEGR
jgi:hypothetical protein